jgi:quercetin dioxygenase-like cupin family protein
VAEIVMPHEGEIVVLVKGERRRPKPGETVVIPAGVEHAIHTPRGHGSRYFFGFQRLKRR